MRIFQDDYSNGNFSLFFFLVNSFKSVLPLQQADFSTQKYSLLKISVVMAMAMLLGLDARTRVAMGLDANPRMGLKRTLSSVSASASGFPSKQQDDGDKKEAISTLSSASNIAENGEKKERIVVKINLAAWRKRKAQKEEEEKRKSLELKLEASKRKLQLGYQQVQKAKRKIQLVDLRDIPKPKPEVNLSKKSKFHHRH
ncbi:uncharacterized protein LOC115954242 isoform X1 [Quercus lobata]|uniref:uncharacterized protein LOC115954242 isoform X1 n=1 Tax=Quercus lobata TaxID=97700 RepID=UPI0012468AED|nr:uncharacterized protein LOC115954242 isoform X1 [Quercus lobata]